MAKNSSSRLRTKHIDVRNRWLTEQVTAKRIDIQHIPGSKQVADMLTKPLSKPKFEINRKLLMMLLSVMLILGTLRITESYSFTSVKPVFYVPSDRPVFNGTKEFQVTIMIMSPCMEYFRSWNQKFFDECNKEFHLRTSTRLKHCKPLQTKIISNQENLPEIRRDKRVAPAIIFLVYAVIAGAQVYSLIRSELNTNNIQEIASATNEGRKGLIQGINALNKTRMTIHGVNDKLIGIERRLDFIDQKIDAYPQIVALVLDYVRMFESVEESLIDIDEKAGLGKISVKLLKLLKTELWQEPASKWSTLSTCTTRSYGEHYELTMRFRIPIRESQVKILSGKPFRFWNQTEANQYCLMQYVGPSFILTNQTNNCFRSIQNDWFDEGALRAHTCSEENGKLEDIGKLYHRTSCTNKFVSRDDDIQHRESNGFGRIYCYGHHIIVRDTNYTCPNYVFEIPLGESYVLNTYVNEPQEGAGIVVDTLNVQINREISRQLKIENVKMHGVNLTQLDNAFKFLDELMNKLDKNVTISQLELPEFVKSPIREVVRLIKTVWGKIEKMMVVTAIIIALIILAMISPLLKVLVILVYTTKSMIRKISERFSSSLTSRSNETRKDKYKRFLDDYYA